MAKQHSKYDFLIVGGGLIGSLISILLSKNNFKCCLIERNLYDNHKNISTFSPLSLNYRTTLILKKFNLWDSSSIKAYPIRNLNIKCFNSLTKLKFSSQDLDLEYLGYVVNKNLLHQYFIEIAKGQKNLDIIDTSVVKELDNTKNGNQHHIVITDTESKRSRIIKSNFMILSDGQTSILRDKLKFKTTHKDYNQTSYMINCTGKFDKSLAVQLFNENGIFALIPYSSNKASIVLTLNQDKQNIFLDSQNQINKTEVEKIFRGYLRDISNEKIISKYEMKTIQAEEIIKGKIMLLGNSSQLIHPVGAQGFNLGVRNIETIIDTFSNQDSYHCVDSLNNAANKILEDRNKILEVTDVATQIFANPKIIPRVTSAFLVNSLKILPGTKISFLKRILGLDECSYLTIKG